jgi:hypothetical protein
VELAPIVIKWPAWPAVRQQIKKQKNTQPTVAACWQTTLNMGWTGWFQTVPQVLGG